jgi:hypothetical protein
MRFDPWQCPECGEPADGTVEVVHGKALLAFDENGKAGYSGETKIWWDEQRPILDEGGKYTLICPEGHEWQAVQTNPED